MRTRAKQIVAVYYGITAIAVGVSRHLQTGDSMEAVWFGIVFGGMSIIGAIMLGRRNPAIGYVAIAISLLFEAGWFLHRVISGHPEGLSYRILIILAASAVTAPALAWPLRQDQRS